jgi:polysaccharide biosynthesis transport protein
MKLNELLHLIWKHRRLLVCIPVLMVVLVVLLTRNPNYTYTSETTLYTGMASAGGLDLFSSLNSFTTSTAFDNFIGIVRTRETQQQVALGLLAQHLLLDKPNPKYLSEKSFAELKSITPDYIRSLVVRPESLDSMQNTLSADSIQQLCFLQTVKNLEKCMAQNDTNFVYKLLNYNHPHYSLYAISSIQATRMESSDMVRLRYDSNDPAICQQTLALFTVACITNYRKIKENRSEALIHYFENELSKAAEKLKESEALYLKFNEKNSIINFSEQTKSVATAKENMETILYELKIKLAGSEAAIKRIEEKLNGRGNQIVKSTKILQMRNRLSEVNARIAAAESVEGQGTTSVSLKNLRSESNELKKSIESTINELYASSNTTEGISVEKLLDEWIKNVLVYEETKAALEVQKQRVKEFKDQYDDYASNGTDIMRIERDLNVAEQSYLKMLEGLNQAKLKIQDAELSGSIKTVDPPFYPLTPNPTKRKILVLIAGLFGFLLVLTFILAMEYFDNSLKNPEKATQKLKLKMAGLLPKITKCKPCNQYEKVLQRNIDRILQQSNCFQPSTTASPRIITLISTLENEGKTTLATNLATRLTQLNKQVLYLKYCSDKTVAFQEFRTHQHANLFSILLGYKDKRVDCAHPFLNAEKQLSKDQLIEFPIRADFAATQNWQDLLASNESETVQMPDFVLIELPPVLHAQYPVNVLANADEVLLICRANREWSKADADVLNGIASLRDRAPVFVLNGVESEVIESIYGEMPNTKSPTHRWLKNVVRFQFFNRQHI